MGVHHSVPQSVLELVRAQSGVVRRDQLRAAGVTARTLSRRTAEGLWQPRGRRVLVFAGTAPGLRTEALVVGHALHPRGVLTGFAALAVTGELTADPWRTVEPPPLPWIRHPGPARVPALVLRSTSSVASRAAEGLRVATSDQVLLDLARFLPRQDATALMLRIAQLRGPVRLAAMLGAALAEGPRSGNEQVRHLVDLLGTGAESEAERRLVELLVAAGFSGFVTNLPVRVGSRVARIDVAFPAHRLAIEVDGRAYHSDARRFQADRSRQNLLVAAGWRVLRFTWWDLTERPDYVLAQIGRLIAA